MFDGKMLFYFIFFAKYEGKAMRLDFFLSQIRSLKTAPKMKLLK